MSIETIAQEQFETFIKDDKTVILFLADWCPLCQEVFSLFEVLTREFPTSYPDCHIKIASADFDRHNLTNHRYGIYGVPTVAAFYEGELLDTWPGLRPEAEYQEILRLLHFYHN
jgi:thioredoxin-like negative regulator of GroEL